MKQAPARSAQQYLAAWQQQLQDNSRRNRQRAVWLGRRAVAAGIVESSVQVTFVEPTASHRVG